MSTVKNGTSVYDIKEFMTNQVAPKYFSKIADMNQMNVGLFGYITEILANSVNDSYFTITSLFKEIFPLRAELPESIYNHATLYQLENMFAVSAEMPFTLLIAEEAVINNSTSEGNYAHIDIDSSMNIDINGISFLLDYDVRITTKKTINGYVHTAFYIMDTTNSISGLMNPYIRTNIYTNDNGKRYIMLDVSLHQVKKKTVTTTIINNDKINMVSQTYNFEGQLANFEVYYKAPGDTTYTQLKKQMVNTAKPDVPFCFYKLADENKLQIDFSNDDRYFVPKYNSEIIVELYTCDGASGNFEKYEGSDINIVGKSDKYSSNKGIIFMGTVTGESVGGCDRKDIEDLRNEVVKAFSTVKSFTTTSDLNLYFDSIKYRQKNDILFMKKRDDAFERLFCSFILFRDQDGDVIPTNTLDMRVDSADVDYYIPQTYRNVLKAGKLYEYVKDKKDLVEKSKDLKYTDNLDKYENDRFVYVNPFLTIVCTNPLSVGFYLNTVNSTMSLQYKPVSSESFNQFIANTLTMTRDALSGSDEYKFSIKIAPTVMLAIEAFTLIRDDTLVKDTDVTFTNPTDGYKYIDNNILKVVIAIQGDGNVDKALVDLKLTGFDEDYYFFEGSIKTNDYISMNQHIQMISGFKEPETFTDAVNPTLIPATSCKMNIYTFYKYPDATPQAHQYSAFEALKYFTMTNKYVLSDDNLAYFVTPVPELRSYVQYATRGANNKYGFRLEGVPLIKANYLKMENAQVKFMESFNTIYKYIKKTLDMLTNNFSIDLKFFNTYGYSKHYYVVDTTNKLMDKVNIKIAFDVKYNMTADAEQTTANLKEHIRKYIESTKITLVSSPSLYISNLIASAKDSFPSIIYLLFKGINNYDASVQALESNVNETNIVQGVIPTSNVIPEYLNIEYLIANGKRTPQIFINVL